MFNITAAFSGFSVDDLQRAKAFYAGTLGLRADEEHMGLTLHVPGGSAVFVYAKEDHEPATFTILNFVVDDIDEAVTELSGKGIRFERYDDLGAEQDQKGVLRGRSAGMGPDIAWFKDPAGNVLSVLQEG